ncbi:MAG: hypothetical protein DHS20C15_24390 [Planctomycetota bacterium]|nr:MAG: hypothetical protein DHS20C15_24390 [Planctomycetota bacterium]
MEILFCDSCDVSIPVDQEESATRSNGLVICDECERQRRIEERSSRKHIPWLGPTLGVTALLITVAAGYWFLVNQPGATGIASPHSETAHQLVTREAGSVSPVISTPPRRGQLSSSSEKPADAGRSTQASEASGPATLAFLKRLLELQEELGVSMGDVKYLANVPIPYSERILDMQLRRLQQATALSNADVDPELIRLNIQIHRVAVATEVLMPLYADVLSGEVIGNALTAAVSTANTIESVGAALRADMPDSRRVQSAVCRLAEEQERLAHAWEELLTELPGRYRSEADHIREVIRGVTSESEVPMGDGKEVTATRRYLLKTRGWTTDFDDTAKGTLAYWPYTLITPKVIGALHNDWIIERLESSGTNDVHLLVQQGRQLDLERHRLYRAILLDDYLSSSIIEWDSPMSVPENPSSGLWAAGGSIASRMRMDKASSAANEHWDSAVFELADWSPALHATLAECFPSQWGGYEAVLDPHPRWQALMEDGSVVLTGARGHQGAWPFILELTEVDLRAKTIRGFCKWPTLGGITEVDGTIWEHRDRVLFGWKNEVLVQGAADNKVQLGGSQSFVVIPGKGGRYEGYWTQRGRTKEGAWIELADETVSRPSSEVR